MNNLKQITPPVAIFLAAAFLECPSLIRSTYFSEIALKYILLAVTLLLFIVLIRHLTRSESAEYLASSVSILMLSNWSQPLLYFTCGIKTAEDAERENMSLYAELLVKRTETFAFIAISTVPVVWITLTVIEKLKGKQWIPTVLCFLVCIALSAVMFLFSDSSSNTSTIAGVQPAIVMMFLMLYCFAAFLSRESNIAQKTIYIFCFAVMMSLLAYKHEMGVPILCYISCLIMYSCLFPIPSFKFLVAFITAPIVALSALMIMFPGLRSDTIEKITTRISSENDHSSLAVENLRYAGLFGSYTFDCSLPQGTSDFSVNVSLHFFGFLWGTIFLIAFITGCRKKVTELSKSGDFGLLANIKNLCFMAFCIIIGYNLLVNLGITPVVGVQALFSGNSFSIAILSGLLFGGMTYNKKLFITATVT